MIAQAALGLGLGIVTGMPLGVVNVAIVDAAALGRRRFATAIGLGGALADTIHAGLAFAGIGRLVTSRPELVRWLAIAAAILIIGYAVVAWRQHRVATPATADGHWLRGLTTGFALTLPNPGALAAWVAVAASLWPEAEVFDAVVIAAGVGIGSAAWFALLARLIGGIRKDHAALAVIPKLALVILVAIAIVGGARAI